MTAGTAPPVSRRASPGQRLTSMRGDIEGLRAIAVMMVLLYHVGVPGLSGGFAGVDVFFVISGFLITGLLVKEATRDGSVSLPQFYARRARRLLPAASLVLVATAVAGALFLPRGQHGELGTDVLGATLYVVNWVFAGREVDYLAEDAAPSLLQHYWSLSVEEQFYVVWPLLIIMVVWLCSRLRLRLLPVLTVVLGALVASSLAWSVLATRTSPTTAYFVTTTRAWQLGVGALLVLVGPLLTTIRPQLARTLGWLGLAGILATVLLVTESTPWPGSVALLPTLGTAAVIAAGSAVPGNPVARLLSHRPLIFMGAISYGLYLWHWPILRLHVETRPDAGLAERLVVGLACIPLARVTLKLVENPIRFHRELGRRPSRALALGAVVMLVSATAGATLHWTAPQLGATTLAADQGALSLVEPASRFEETLHLVADPASAVTHVDRTVPDPAVVDEDLSLAYRDGCQVTRDGTERLPTGRCTLGDPRGRLTAVLVGDSKAEQWSSALHAISVAEGWQLRVYTKSACGFVDEGRDDSCHAYNTALASDLAAEPPDLLFTSAGAGYAGLTPSMVSLLQPIVDSGTRLVVLADTPSPKPRGVPDDVTTYECLDRHRTDWSPCWSDVGPASGDVILPAVAEQLGGTYLDLNPWTCPAPERLGGCAPVVGGVVVHRQGSHLSGSYVRSLTPVLHHDLIVVGIADSPLSAVVWTAPTDPAPAR